MAEHEELQSFLTEEYQMPKDVWLEDVRKTFRELQSLLEWHHEEIITGEETTFKATPADKARAAASPLITILESGNHTLGLTASSEPLQCIAFGTIPRTRFKERFWEVYLGLEENAMIVYEANEYTNRYKFQFQGHLFQVLYIQAEELIREHPDILSVPINSVESQFECSKEISEAIRNLQEERQNIAYFSKPSIRTAYYFVRAWIISQGRFRNSSLTTGVEAITTRDIVQMFLGSDFKDEISESASITDVLARFETKFFAEHCKALGIGSLSQATSSESSYLQLLREVKTLHEKMGCDHYIRINLLHNGSGLQRIRWLTMIEYRLAKLKRRIDEETAYTPRIWPQRLIEINEQSSTTTSTQDDVFEACYIIGLKRQTIGRSVGEVETEVTKWKAQVELDDEHIKNQCYITTLDEPITSFATKTFKPCTLLLNPEQIYPPEERQYQSLLNSDLSTSTPKKPSSKSKSKKSEDLPTTLEEPTRKLRPASEVLKRLRYDRTFNIDEYKVGYNDRHNPKIQEKAAVNWTTDTTADEFIPEHRIEYFKRYPSGIGEPELMWDRKKRVDKIFKDSGN